MQLGKLALAAALPAACVGWGLLEARLYRLRSYRIPMLPPGADPIRILQVSDLHLRLSTQRLAGFLVSLSGLSYD
ncbi:MAG: metallophosphoesterase, partial [Candidatus Methylomirabilales bacterium]